MPIDGLVPAQFDCESDCQPRVVTLRDGTVIDAIGSETARGVLAALQDTPRPVSKIADELDASIQVISYHIDRLEAAELVRTVGTTYSEKGKEMEIYAPATNEIVIELDGCSER